MFYRFGGMDKPFKSWMRDWVCPIFSLGVLLIQRPDLWNWLLVPSYLLMAGALSTYWDWLTKIWRKTEDKYWENWMIHGFFIGISIFPLYWAGLDLSTIFLNGLFSAITMMVVSELSENVWVEECGRGTITALVRIIHG